MIIFVLIDFMIYFANFIFIVLICVQGAPWRRTLNYKIKWLEMQKNGSNQFKVYIKLLIQIKIEFYSERYVYIFKHFNMCINLCINILIFALIYIKNSRFLFFSMIRNRPLNWRFSRIRIFSMSFNFFSNDLLSFS